MDDRVPYVVGISGASGTPYAAAVLRALLAAGEAVDLVVSAAARLTILDETHRPFRDSHWRQDLAALLGIPVGADPHPDGDVHPGPGRVEDPGDLVYWSIRDLAAGPSSGSYPTKGMLVVPASTDAVAGIALGLSKDLLQRAAAVTLKEGRPLVVVPREMPLARATLVHLLALSDAGAVVAPASPGFYHGPTELQQLVDFVAGRVLDAVGVPHDLYRRWTGGLGETPPGAAEPPPAGGGGPVSSI